MKFKIFFIVLTLVLSQGIILANNIESVKDAGDFVTTSAPEKTDFYSDNNKNMDSKMNEFSIYDFLISNKKSLYFNVDKMNEENSCMQSFFEAVERYEQGNTTSSYKSFESIINESSYNDFYYMLMAYKLSDMGFFSLANSAINKVGDKYIWQEQIDALKQYYFPEYMHSTEEEMFLADIQSSINYSNLTHESIADVMKKDKIIKRSDYALYLVAEALYAEKDYQKALNLINKAFSINPYNVYYSELKAKILTEQKKYNEAIDVIVNIEQKNGLSPVTLRELDSIKYIAMSKAEGNPLKSKYYLALYFFANKDYAKALNELSIVNYKNKLPEAYTLAGNIHFLNKEFEKASDSYQKALAIDKKHSFAYSGLGNILVLKKDYSGAKKAYLKAEKYDKKNIENLLNLAFVSMLENDNTTASNYCDKAIVINNKAFQPYYVKSKINQENEQADLRKAIRLNPFYSNSWLDLTTYYIEKNDFKAAENCLASVKFLEEKSYRYYYYNAMLAKMNSDSESANNNFKKAVNLYSTKNSIFINVPTANIKEF